MPNVILKGLQNVYLNPVFWYNTRTTEQSCKGSQKRVYYAYAGRSSKGLQKTCAMHMQDVPLGVPKNVLQYIRNVFLSPRTRKAFACLGIDEGYKQGFQFSVREYSNRYVEREVEHMYLIVDYMHDGIMFAGIAFVFPVK